MERVLDLGSRSGSFGGADGLTVYLDREVPAGKVPPGFVQADAAQVPFGAAAFDRVIANHSFEHFDRLDDAIAEAARVLRPGGGLYVAVPDASTLCDRLYRWLARGGGHVNAFVDPGDLRGRLEAATGMACRATVVLHTGFSYLNRRNGARPPRKAWLVGGGWEPTLVVASWLCRWLDGWLGTRLSVYGWAYYFGSAVPEGLAARTNVCVRCGAGHSYSRLRAAGAGRWYRCPGCGAGNIMTADAS